MAFLTRSRKAQYSKKLKEWGFLKSQTKEVWKTLNKKIETRKRAAKDSNVYCSGELLPAKKLRKALSHQGYLTFSEQFNLSQGRRLHASVMLLLMVIRNAPANTRRIRDTHTCGSACV